MKKLFTLLVLAGMLTAVSCARKNCPAYSSVEKAPAGQVQKV